MKYKKIPVFVMMLLVILQLSVFADFKKDKLVTLENADGSRVEAYITGDEYVQVLHDIDGYVLVKTDSGNYEYAKMEDEVLVPCGNKRSVKYAELGEEYFIQQREKVFAAMESAGVIVPNSSPNLFSSTDSVIEFKGEGTVIVVPIAFSGGSCDFEGFAQRVNDACEYFKEVSYGELELGFYDVSLGNEVFVSTYPEEYYHPYDSANRTGYLNVDQRLAREKALVSSAISHYGLSQRRIDEPLDVNGDGNNDFLVFVYNTEIESAWNSLLWAHQIAFTSSQFNILGKGVNRWMFIPRSERSETLSHEMYHAIGAEDLYGYSDQRSYLGMWDIMDEGNGTMLSYMKYRYGGWIDEIPEITRAGTYTLNPVHEKTNNCFKIPINSREYYVVEYRNRFSGRVNCLDRWRQWHNEGLLITRVDSTRHGKGNSDAYENGAEISLVTHPALGTNSVLGAVLPEFSPESGFDRSLASGGADNRTVIKNIRENADGTLSFDVSFDGETTQKYLEDQGVVIRSTVLRDSEGKSYLKLATYIVVYYSDGSYDYQEAQGVYDIKYLYLKGGETSANSCEYTDYTSPFLVSDNGFIWAYMVTSNGARVGETFCANALVNVPGINTARMVREFEYGTYLLNEPDGKKLYYLSFADGDRYTGKLFMDNIVTFTVDGVEYEFLSEDIRGEKLVFAADSVDVFADDGSEVYMTGMAFDDYAEKCMILFDSNNGRSSIFEKAETITEGDGISLSVPGDFSGEIRYTLDGTTPTASSALYEGPVAFFEDTSLVTASFLNGKLKSRTDINVYVQKDYREYSASELNRIFKNSGTAFAGGSGKYLKISYTAGSGTLILRNSDWVELAKIVNPQDSGVVYVDAQNEVFVQEASGNNISVTVVDSANGVDVSILKNADGSGKLAVHSFDTVGDFELIKTEFNGGRFVDADSWAVTLSENGTEYRPFSATSNTIKAFCFDSLENIEPQGVPVCK